MWFLRKKNSSEAVAAHSAALKAYIEKSLELYRKAQRERLAEEARRRREQEQAAQNRADSGIRYSSRDIFDDADIKYSRRGIFDVQSYQSWEKTQKSFVTFSAKIRRLIEQRNLTNREFYRRADIDRKLFSKLYNDFTYQPSKNTAIRCCLALHLNEAESIDLLKSAGFAFSDNSPFDLAIRYCIIHGVYDIGEVNGLLDAMEIVTL